MQFISPGHFAVSALLLLLLWTGYLEATDEKFKARRGKVTVHKRSPKQRHVQLQLEEQIKDVELSKIELQYTNSPPSMKRATTAMFVSPDGNVTCSETCGDDMDCYMHCIEEYDDVITLLTADSALVIERGDYDDWILAVKNAGGRRKRCAEDANILLSPNLWPSVAVIKILAYLDAGFMNVFLGLSNGNTAEAKLKAETFVTLMYNKVNLYYQTLQQYKKSFRTTSGTTYPLNIYTYLRDIQFPPIVNGAFQDPTLISKNVENGQLRTYYLYDQYYRFLGISGMLADAAYYIRQVYGTNPNFNLMTFLSGSQSSSDKADFSQNTETMTFVLYTLDLNKPKAFTFHITREQRYKLLFKYLNVYNGQEIGRVTNVIGVAFQSVICRSFANQPYNLQFSFNTLHSPLVSKVVAHETGHNIGAPHDGSTSCPASAFRVMAPSIYHSLRRFDQFYQFSTCSADFIANYLSRFSNFEITQCLFTDRPSEKEFLDKFCQGLNGYNFSINAICKIFFGPSSYVCTGGTPNLIAGYLANDKCSTDFNINGYVPPVLQCASVTGCSGSSNRLYDSFDGTKCADPGGNLGNSVCFKGKCVSGLSLCSNRTS